MYQYCLGVLIVGWRCASCARSASVDCFQDVTVHSKFDRKHGTGFLHISIHNTIVDSRCIACTSVGYGFTLLLDYSQRPSWPLPVALESGHERLACRHRSAAEETLNLLRFRLCTAAACACSVALELTSASPSVTRGVASFERHAQGLAPRVVKPGCAGHSSHPHSHAAPLGSTRGARAVAVEARCHSL